jgi:fumiquinazoline A oxidase
MIPTIDKFSQEIRAKVQKGSGKPKLEAYVNFGHGDEGPAAWYSAEKLPRLLALKAAYDPWNLFGYFNGVVSR